MNEEIKPAAQETTLAQLINQPREFKVGNKTLTVEAQPAGAVTLIITKIIEKIRTVDLEILQESVRGKGTGGAESLYELFAKRLQSAMVKDFEIYQMILTPAATWAAKRGNLKPEDYPVTLQELEWETPEAVLGEIFDEWLARNPRFAIQKKMVNLAVAQQ